MAGVSRTAEFNKNGNLLGETTNWHQTGTEYREFNSLQSDIFEMFLNFPLIVKFLENGNHFFPRDVQVFHFLKISRLKESLRKFRRCLRGEKERLYRRAKFGAN